MLAACSGRAARLDEKQETKEPVPLEDFWKMKDSQYVEGDGEKKAAYEKLFSLIGGVQIVTQNMDGFTPCTIDNLEWLGEA